MTQRSKFVSVTIVVWLSISIFFCAQANANPQAPNSSCLLLGPDPSLIIRFRHYPSQFLARKQLNRADLQAMTRSDTPLTRAKRMSHGYYVVYFKREKPSRTLITATSTGSECYTQSALAPIILAMKQSPQIAEVTPNFLSSMMDVAQSNISQQWNLQRPPGGIDAEAAWRYTTGVPWVTIAVLDTGILPHPALSANILPGVHFTRAGETGRSAEPSCTECGGYEHGTMVAGIVAATGEYLDGGALFGVARHSSILPINVFTKFTDQTTCGSPPCLYSYLSDQINALAWLAGDEFSNVPSPPKTIVGINLSFGNEISCPVATQNALNRIHSKEWSVIVAAGNHNNDAARNYPANCQNVISVAATGFYGERAAYSSWGKTVTIAAPGGNERHSIYTATDGAYRYKQGTSLAAPHVSGVIALLYAIDSSLNAEQIKKIITAQEAITPFPSPDMLPRGALSCNDRSSPEKSCGVGIINANKAVQKLLSTDTNSE